MAAAAPDVSAVAAVPDSAWLTPRPEVVRPPEPLQLGGCGRACESPESAVSFLLTQLTSPDAATLLRPLIDWSLLVVDDRDLGTHWAMQWADPAQRAAREAEITAFLAEWTRWPGRSLQADGWGRMRGSGIQLRLQDEQTAVVRLRHPPLRDDATEPVWQLQWHKRGAEWLLSGIDHQPSLRGKQ
ncbi:MAG: hypothetical protein HY902_17820 [Deltaproteobacteria bacterium]|nr:hypothetical protein [Deltaproteobacteria bacterium]